MKEASAKAFGRKARPYVYAHDEPEGIAAQQHLPDGLHEELADRSYYRPTDRGFEARLQERWRWIRDRLRGQGVGRPLRDGE
jgi:putative ATPase